MFPLHGRPAERAAIDALLSDVRDGLSGALLLVGDPGAGKTRLLQYAAAASADLRVIRLDGVEPEAGLAFAALHRLLRPFLDRIPGIPGPQRDALRVAFGLTGTEPPDRYLAGLATLTVLSAVAVDTPVLCLIDDVHWLDRESAEVLAFTARRLRADSLGFVFAARPDAAGRSVFASVPVLDVGGLGVHDASALLAARVAGTLDPAVAQRMVAETGGNPLALIEIAARLRPEQLAGVAPLPDRLPVNHALDLHFRAAITGLPPATRTLLLLMAAAPVDDAPLIWRAAGLLGLSPPVAQPAVRHGILVLRPRLGFRHPLIRAAAYAGADSHECHRVHTALAAAYDCVGDAERAAWHRGEAAVGPGEPVAAELEAAAELARARGGYAQQALFLARAAELTPAPGRRAERLLAAADAHVISGDSAAAGVLLDLAAAVVSDPVARARALRTRAAVETFHVRVASVPATLLDAVVELGDRDPRMTWDLLFRAMHAAIVAREHITGTTLADVAKATASAWHDLDAPPGSADATMGGLALRIAEGHAQAAPILRTALSRLRAAADLKELDVPFSLLITFATDELWDIEARRELTERIAASDRAQGALYALSLTFLVQAQAEIYAGRFAEAEACYAQADEFFAAIGFSVNGAVNRLQLLAWTGQEARLRATVAEITAFAGTFGHGHIRLMAMQALATLNLGLGRYQSALDHALTVFREDPPSAGNLVLPLIVEAGARAAHREAAAAALARMDERARAAGTPWGLGLLARCRALLGTGEHAEESYLESVRLLGQVPVGLDLAHTRLLFGEWLRRRKRRAEARVQLRAAHEVFRSCGAVPFAERARAELLATGEQVSKRSAPAGNDLTQQERHVAVLAAGGQTNAEIAEQLFVTVSTVEFHLNKVFRKLGISSRREIAARIAEREAAAAHG